MTAAPNQFEIAGPVFKPETQYLTSQGYPLGTTCWFFEVKINFRCEIICGDTIDSAWAAVVAHLHAEGGLPNVYARNCQRQLEINHQAIHECRDDLLEADAFAKIEKLERERDEARREAIRWQDAWMNETTLQEMGSTLMPWMHDWKQSQENDQAEARGK